jgi:hypothetical protein
MFIFPVLFFFVFNLLTPYWWDDFPNACFTVSWSVPRERLISSLGDMIESTRNLYTHPVLAGNGRVVVNFLQFVFCAPRNKIIFDVCNTLVYTLFIILICYHGSGSFKKIRPPVFLSVNMAVWLFTPSWGQDFLWLTGSLNYLWGLTFVLLFLIPYRKKVLDNSYRLNVILSILFFIAGLITGWTMQNISATLCVMLACYFIRKFLKKEKICLFEICGTIGILAGFYCLLAVSNVGASVKAFILELFVAIRYFIYYCSLLLGILIIMGIEIFVFRKKKIEITLPFGYLLIAAVSFFSLALGYVRGRALLTSVVFLLVLVLNLLKHLHETQKRWVWGCVLLFCVFIPSFSDGGKEIIKSYLLSKAREEFIYTEKNREVMDIYVKTPIPVQDSHSGLYDGIDILPNTDNDSDEYSIHNNAKSLFYGIHSLTGVNTDGKINLRKSLKEFIANNSGDAPAKNMFAIIYRNWGTE